MKILVTGFTPFGGEQINPSWEAVRRLPNRIGRAELIKHEIPTEFDASGAALHKLLTELRPDAVLCVGQYGGANCIRVERVAINLRDARIADNAGKQPTDEPVVAGGPDAYFATIPTREIVDALREQGIPFPNDFRRDHTSDQLHAEFDGKENEELEALNIEVAVAGRMMTRRIMGKPPL